MVLKLRSLSPCPAEAVIAVVPVAHKYGISCVLEDCANQAKSFKYTMKENSSTDAFKWIELADKYEVSGEAYYTRS